MSWETVVGIETHAQLATRSKIFSGASAAFGGAPNTQASAVDIALPGVLPVLNRAAVECAIRFGLAVGATIRGRSVFARKNYFYPDLPKGYQISQYELPIVVGGTLTIASGDAQKVIRLTRAHLEEDAGKSLHEDFHGMTGIDLNRAGTPLLEIVSEPELRGAAEAVAYAKTLHGLLRWIHICDGNMQEGSFRCDANVSVRRLGDPVLGTRCEIKNLNSFRFMEQAIEFEARRQIGVLEDGGTVTQETRLYDPETGETRPMRTKEDAQDYRYFPDPDLLPLVVSEEWINEIRGHIGELPAERLRRFRSYGLSDDASALLNADFDIGNYFDGVVRESLRSGETLGSADFKSCANWVINDVNARRNADGLESWQFGVSDNTLGYMLRLHRNGVLSAKTVKALFSEFWEESKANGFSVHGGHPERVDEVIAQRGLQQWSDAAAIETLVVEVLAANPKSVAEFRAGKEKAFHALVGQVMKAARGKANPAQVTGLLRRKLQA